MSETKLVGYARKSLSGNALKINLSVEAFMEAERYAGKDGREYVGLVLNANKVRSILDGQKEVTGVSQFIDE